MASVVFRQPEFNTYLNEPRGAVGEFLEKRGRLMLMKAKAQVGVKSGALQKSIRVIHERGMLGQYLKIGSTLPYALLHHEGTRPHLITADDGRMLRFTSQGRVVYSRQVMHPGTKPNRYLSDQLWIAKAP